jgi:hypothetical protein
LYEICLDPFLSFLNSTLQGIKIGHRTVKTNVVAYADDVTLFFTTPQDISTLQEAIQQYSNTAIQKSGMGPNKSQKGCSNSIRYMGQELAHIEHSI